MKEAEEGVATPEVNGHAEEVEEGEEVKSKQQEEKEEAESRSNGSADTEVVYMEFSLFFTCRK